MAHGGRGTPHCLIWPKRVSAAKQGMDFRVVSFQLDQKPLKEREGWRREVNICGTSTGLSRLLEPRSLRGRAGQPTLAYNIMTHTGGKSPRGEVFPFSIYTLSDLGDLSNLIGSLSRTIQQYSPPGEWIMCELGVFPVFFRERSFKSRQNPRADFF